MAAGKPKSTGWDDLAPAPPITKTAASIHKKPQPRSPASQTSSDTLTNLYPDLNLNLNINSNLNSPPKPKPSPSASFAWSQAQLDAIRSVVDRRQSVFITGSAGTGKSFLLQEIIRQLKDKNLGKSLVVTASTGAAACLIGGRTLHSFAGIGLGKEPKETLCQNIMKNYVWSQRWLRTRVLIIDEISMITGGLFDKLEYIAREVRSSNQPFGGIQLVLCGDFMQLPPVMKNEGFCFESPKWNECIKKTIVFSKIFRQRDSVFQRILNEMRFNTLSESSIRTLESLSRPLVYDDGIEPTVLLSTREEVHKINTKRLNSITGEEKTYTADYSGPQSQYSRLINMIMSPEILHLKIGAQVILTRNQNPKEYPNLVNGSTGIVTSYGTTGPVVRFVDRNGLATIAEVSPVAWDIYDADGTPIAKITQIPLFLAYALSIHKSQGQTIPRVHIDLKRVFECSQAYVAISRASCVDGLRVDGFSVDKVMTHPKAVEFYRAHAVIGV